jgi:ketosteroid isomerase-like protein
MAANLMACRRDRWRRQQVVVYTAMTTQAGDVVAQYYAAFDSHRDGWQDLVTDDMVFDGPVQHARGKAEFVTLTGQFLQAHRETHLLGRVEDGNRVASLFEFVMDAPNGQRLVCPVAEWATVADGRISEFRVYYDPRDFLRAFGVAD